MDTLWTILKLILISTGAWFIYRTIKVIKSVYSVLSDYFVLWHIAFGAHPSRRVMGASMRQHVYVCPTHLLDSVSVKEFYDFCGEMIQSETVSIDDFHRIMLTYTYVIACRERIDGSLRGMLLLGKEYNEENDCKYTLIKLGLALVRHNYRGGPLLYYVFVWHVLKELICHPKTPVYMTGKAFSHLSYLTLVNNITVAYPCHGKDIPAFERKILNNFAESIRRKDEVYNPDTFVLERELSTLQEHVTTITPEDMKNPNINFFVQSNPGWEKGHCMFTIGKVTWSDIANIVWKSMTRAKKGRKERQSIAIPNRIQRGMSFQDRSARKYVFQHYQADAMAISTPPRYPTEDYDEDYEDDYEVF